MKSVQEIKEMLLNEICHYSNKVDSTIVLEYYNSLMGDTSFLLAGLLDIQLKEEKDWDKKKWVDDCLITKVKRYKDKVFIWGVMIIGKEDTTEQWTEPVYCQTTISKNCSILNQLTILFSEEKNSEITYEDFIQNRDMWDGNFYSDDDWAPSERNWKYIITV